MKRVLFSIALLGGCAGVGEDSYRERAEAALKAGFAGGDPKILARVERQDEVQRLCSEHRDAPPAAIAASIRSGQRAGLRYPASGRLMGDWRAGKKIAEDAGGLRYGDPAGKPAGGNCYACHQVEEREIAYGTLGPSLLAYGKKRSGKNRSGAGVDAAVRETYERLYNPQAFTACSAMPRFGHNGVLTPEQIAHLVALLLDPASPVNR
jgi:sulfur-oxidizing protein SoxX